MYTDPDPNSPDWQDLPHEELPKPTTSPFFASIGITLFFWGLITSPILIVLGLVVLSAALFSWIKSTGNTEHPTDHHP